MMVNRREIRYQWGIKGSGCTDCLAVGLCCWCACVQEEREVVVRSKGYAEAVAAEARQPHGREEMRYVPGGGDADSAR